MADKGKSQSSIRVLVADDHTLFREGLCQLLEAEADVTVAGEAQTAEECLRLATELAPHVVLLDLMLPDRHGLEVLEELVAAGARVIVLTASEDERDYVEAVRLGARGLVLKQAASDRLLEGIRKVYRGEVWLDRRVAAEVKRALEAPAGAGRDVLTSRELEIVTLVARGFRNKEIGEKLDISEQTVKNHLHNIFDKLGVSDRLELALYALHHRLARG
jgi:DNA-binding NarL/FixJ family response regulator